MGNPIQVQNGKFVIPDQPIIPFIEGDGVGRDIWRASKLVFDAAVERSYGGKRQIEWREVLAGEKAFNQTGSWLAGETLDGSGVPSPMKRPEKVNVVIFRENTEDVYAGIEWQQGTPECAKVIEFLTREM